jgi:Fe-S cluster biogenesis protein NfuA
MFIQTETTPNPATLKFLPGRDVMGEGTRDFISREAAIEASPLAASIFAIEGVMSVFLGADFISVTKNHGEWAHIKPAILGAIMQHFMSGKPVISDVAEAASEGDFDEKDADIVTAIKEILETRVRPAVAGDGGDITFHSYRDGVVLLKMKGACAGCPSSTATLKNGIQNLLRHFIPDVEEVRAV